MKNKQDKLVQEIKDNMIKSGYTEVTRELYHKMKKKVKHGYWKIDKEYFYFLKERGVSKNENKT